MLTQSEIKKTEKRLRGFNFSLHNQGTLIILLKLFAFNGRYAPHPHRKNIVYFRYPYIIKSKYIVHTLQQYFSELLCFWNTEKITQVTCAKFVFLKVTYVFFFYT